MNSLEDDQSSSNPAGGFEGRELVAMAKLCMGGENRPTQQGFGVLEFGDETRALGSATAGQSLKKHGPFFARRKLGIARSKLLLGEPKQRPPLSC